MAYTGSITIDQSVAPPLVVAEAARRAGCYARPDATACTVFVEAADEARARGKAMSFALRFKPRGMKGSVRNVHRSAEPVVQVARF